MSKILILSGSPRVNGNSALLCEEFARGAKDAGHTVDRIDCARKKVGGCFGCGACQRNGETCVQKDDMAEIREKMLDADIIVLASPIYYYSMSAQLKLVIDRTYAFFMQLAGKTFYYIFACAAPEESYTGTMKAALDGFTCCVPDAKVGGIVMGLGVSDPGGIRQSNAMRKAYEMGRSVS